MDCRGCAGTAQGPVLSAGPTAGWALDYGQAMTVQDGSLQVSGETRAYLVRDFTERGWGNHKYLRFDLTNPLTFDVDLSNVPCGCVASVYLVRMADPSLGRSNYCDAALSLIPGMHGEVCTEIDLLEANQNSLQSALHTEPGVGSFGSGRCDKDGCFARMDKTLYGRHGPIIDTSGAFEVRAHVRTGGELTVVLSQADRRTISFDKHMAGNPQGSGGARSKSG
jgi:hypothetical protein